MRFSAITKAKVERVVPHALSLPLHLLLGLLAFVSLAHSAPAANVPANMLLLDGVRVGDAVVAVGERGTILRSADSGRTWQDAPSGTFAALTAVAFAPDARHGWAVGHDATLLATDDAGATWHKAWQNENPELSFLDVCAVDARHVIAVGAYGLFLETTDGGQTWAQRKVLADDMHLNRITRGPDGTLYLAGERGTLLRSIDAGQTWTALPAPYEGSFYGILPLGPHSLLAYGLRGRLYHSSDDGETWEIIATPQPTLLATALPLPDNVIVFAGQSRSFRVSRDGGRTVTAWNTPLTAAVAELLIAPDGGLLAFGEAGATRLALP